MKRLVLSVAVPVLALAVFVGCPSKPKVPEQSPATELSQRSLGDLSHPKVICGNKQNCPYLDWSGSGNKESKPQSPYYRGECLEEVVSVELDTPDGGSASVFTNMQPPGGSWSARGRNSSGRSTRLKLNPITDAGAAFPGIVLFEVLHGQKSLCTEGAEDEITEVDPRNHRPRRGWAIATPGYWQDGVWRDGGTRHFTLSCLSGVVAKCVSWGYLPYAASGEERARYHRACVHAARAGYLTGKDTSYTCQRTVVDVYDRQALQAQGNDAGFEFESLWGENGLICVNRPRWKHCEQELDGGGVRLDPRCPDPADGGTGWPDGALIAIRSSASNEARNQHDAGRCPTAYDALCPGCRINNAGP